MLYLPIHGCDPSQWLERRSGAPEEVRAPDSGFEAGTGVRDSDYLDLRLLLRVKRRHRPATGLGPLYPR
jgi:hypothetical protein